MNSEVQELQKKYEEAKTAYEVCESQLRLLGSEVKKAERDVLFAIHGVRIGSVVKAARNESEYKIGKIAKSYDFNSRPWVDGYKRRKDGSFGEALTYVGSDYEVVTP